MVSQTPDVSAEIEIPDEIVFDVDNDLEEEETNE